MLLTFIGAGYVGLTASACFAEIGHTVKCVDSNSEKIEKLNNNQRIIFEPYLFEMIEKNKQEERLFFYSKIDEALDSDIFFITVGTPSLDKGQPNLDNVFNAVKELATKIHKDFILIIKSTVPVGTCGVLKQIILEELKNRKLNINFEIVSNPEFLKQGSSVNDFLQPDRIIIGCEKEKVKNKIIDLYYSLTLLHNKIIFMSVRSAEMTKYACNAMLATKISFMNEVAGICEALEVDIDSVRKGIGSDTRIGYAFTSPGCGFGGSCLPKDLEALINLAEEKGVNSKVITAVRNCNVEQKQILFKKLQKKIPNLQNKVIGIWGLSYKPETDDLRESPSIDFINELIQNGAFIKAYDPAAMENSKNYFLPEFFDNGIITLANSPYEAIKNVDALVLLTEWKVFQNPDFKLIKELMSQPILLDGRNQYDKKQLEVLGFVYEGIGK